MTEIDSKAEIGQIMETDSEDHFTKVDLVRQNFRGRNFKRENFR